MVIVPVMAPFGPPLTGASMSAMPFASSIPASLRVRPANRRDIGGDLDAFGRQRGSRRLECVIADHLMATALQRQRHASSHIPKSNHANGCHFRSAQFLIKKLTDARRSRYKRLGG
jgi:hypothetical protein